jgi:hypothetical protein
MITTHTCGSLSKTKILKDDIGIECNTKKKFCVLQKKVLSFGPNRTVEVRLNSSAEPNVRSVTTPLIHGDFMFPFVKVFKGAVLEFNLLAMSHKTVETRLKGGHNMPPPL